ncbi:hypothetical protein LTS18_002319, partial [Coniosporium uncinatum]
SPSSDKVQDVSTSNRECAPTAASSFSRFNDLPAELRNRVISEAVNSPAAITNLDMSGVNLGVLLTCKYFRAEGLKCLYENNIFHFSSIETLEKVLEHGLTSSHDDMPRKSSVESILHLSVDVAMGYNQDLDSSTPLSEPVPAMLEGRPGFVMFAIDADSDSNTRKFYLSRFDWSNVLKTILKILK